MMTPTELQSRIARYISSELECEVVDGRIACLTPLSYPNGDGVVVFVTQHNDRFEVTDFSEAYRALLMMRASVDIPSFAQGAESICESLDLRFHSGRIYTLAEAKTVEDAVWRVALASARSAEAFTFTRPQKKKPQLQPGFVEEVERVIRKTQRSFQREAKLNGASGHAHRVTFFLPDKKTLLEPIGAEASWNIASAAYVKFGDLRMVNGYQFISVLDDRTKVPESDVMNLLQQVSKVVSWTRRPEWEHRIFS